MEKEIGLIAQGIVSTAGAIDEIGQRK